MKSLGFDNGRYSSKIYLKNILWKISDNGKHNYFKEAQESLVTVPSEVTL